MKKKVTKAWAVFILFNTVPGYFYSSNPADKLPKLFRTKREAMEETKHHTLRRFVKFGLVWPEA